MHATDIDTQGGTDFSIHHSFTFIISECMHLHASIHYISHNNLSWPQCLYVGILREKANLAVTLNNAKNEVLAHTDFSVHPIGDIVDQAFWEPFDSL